ncbi:MAG TPA: glycoside hydrolase family 13 protein [Bacteroidota bacterium]|nr:glycoside hydrolase family 13 protein [Bacteroidota bacterium]
MKDSVFYQIFPDRFASSSRLEKPSNLEPWDSPPTSHGFKGGDLLGVVERLDYLQDLGVTAIYFNPIFASTANHRYHTFDYFAVDPILGGNAALRELLDQSHARGIRIVLDGVFNHASRGCYQFNHALENGASSPYLDWFYFDLQRLRSGKALNAYPSSGPRRSSWEDLGYKAWWDLPALPKLNTSTPAVRRFIMEVARFWVRFGIDGWRLDVPSEIDDDTFWQEFRSVVKEANPEAYIVGEIWDDATRWLSGDQFDAVMNYMFTKPVMAYFVDTLDVAEARKTGGYHSMTPMNQVQFTKAIDDLLALYDPEVTQAQLNLLDSHDTPRFLTLARGDQSALRLAVLFSFTYPGAPCIYYGDEIGLEGRQDPDCRRTFPWDEGRWNVELHDYYKRCVELRKRHPALRRGSFRVVHSADDVYAFERALGDTRIVVAVNVSRQTRRVALGIGGETVLAPRSSLVLDNNSKGEVFA